ncbi:MAG TPA: histidine kinase [Puia sp.]|nr:histidine kinase [Puia sp.]
MIKRGLLLLLLSWGPATLLSAQDHAYVDYSVKDGLAGSTVYAMAQDRQGFIWLGTETGLSRFDGTKFRNFYTTDGLPDNEIIKLFVDSRNRIWIIPFKNSICYYQHGKIHNQQNDTLLRNLPIHSEVVAVVEDSSGTIAISEADAIHLIDPAGKLTTIRQFGGLPFFLVQAGLDERHQLQFYIGGPFRDDQLVSLRNGQLVLEHTVDRQGPNNYSSTFISPPLEVHEDGDSLHFIDRRHHSQFRLPLPKGFINISPLNDSSVNLNAYSTALLIDVNRRQVVDSFLAGRTISGVLRDSEGDLWFSTLGAGLRRLGARAVRHYSFESHHTSLPVFSIAKIGHTLYVGTENFHLFTSQDDGRSFRDQHLYDFFSRGRITAITALPGNRGIGGNRSIDGDRGLVGTDAGSYLVTPGKAPRMLWQYGAEKALAVSDDSTILDFDGLGAFRRRLADGKLLDTIWPGRATCGCRSADTCYVGTLNGLYAVAPDKKTFCLGDRFPILKARIAALQRAPDGTLWIATYGEGLAAYKEGRLLTRLNTGNGLTSGICRSLFITASDIWVGTDHGLNKITVTDTGYRLVRFTSANGLSSDIINAIDVEGENVFTGGPDGLTQFNEDDLAASTSCRLSMTDIDIVGHQWPPDTTRFALGYDQNDLQFGFAGISFRSGGSMGYRYRLLGLDTGWKNTDQPSLHYTSLAPGNYELQILAFNTFGGASDLLALPFSIARPWWAWTWLRILLLLGIGGLVGSLFQLRVQAIRRKEAEKTATATRIAELEQMALRSRMNPHFIFNCLNSIQLYVMDKDIVGANVFITHFSRLIRQTLMLSARPTISLREEIDYLSTYLELEKTRFEDRFTYHLEMMPEMDRQSYSLPPMILQPYVENAILHGITHRPDNKGHIHIRLVREADCLVCIIEDNGVGRNLAAQYKSSHPNSYPSQGMDLTAKRLVLLNSTLHPPITVQIEDLEAPDHRPLGTRVVIRFPV